MRGGGRRKKNIRGASSRRGRRNSRGGRRYAAVSGSIGTPLQRMTMSRVTLPGIGFPQQLKTCLKYSGTGIFFTGSTVPGAQVFRMNSLFDPDLTGTGHQPLQFDQFAAVYQQYCVTACQVQAKITNLTTVPTLCALGAYDTNVSGNSVENITEGTYSINTICDSNLANGRAKLTLPKLSIAMLSGQRDLNSDPNNYQGVGANPADPVFAIFKCVSMDGITNVNLTVDFYLVFDVIFKELADPSPSLEEEDDDEESDDHPPMKRRILMYAKRNDMTYDEAVDELYDTPLSAKE